MRLACAIVRDDPPQVILAESVEVLQRVIAYVLIAQTSPDSLPAGVPERLREALLAEQWAQALSDWITYTGVPVDVYPEGEMRVHTEETFSRDLSGLELQFTPLFLG
jgi:hypothetical protein